MSNNDNNIDDLGDITAERDRLLGEVARLTVSKETGVPPGLLANANNIDDARALAAEYLQWKAEGVAPQTPSAPAASTGAAVYCGGSVNGIAQVSRETLQYLSAEQINQLRREGRLVGLGVGVDQHDQHDRHNGRPW